jgi:hypothetical protein
MKPLGVTMPFAVPDREYRALAKFMNAAEDQFAVKCAALQPLDHQRSGLTLQMSGKNCSYELQWQNGTVMLGRCHSGKREQLFRGSAAVESTWAKMLEVMRSQEEKVKLEANLPPADKRVRFDLEALRKNYQPKFSRARQIR